MRPWTCMDLTINKGNLETFLNSVLSKIIIKPGIILKTLKKEYCTIIQPMFIRELVEVHSQVILKIFVQLLDINCIFIT